MPVYEPINFVDAFQRGRQQNQQYRARDQDMEFQQQRMDAERAAEAEAEQGRARKNSILEAYKTAPQDTEGTANALIGQGDVAGAEQLRKSGRGQKTYDRSEAVRQALANNDFAGASKAAEGDQTLMGTVEAAHGGFVKKKAEMADVALRFTTKLKGMAPAERPAWMAFGAEQLKQAFPDEPWDPKTPTDDATLDEMIKGFGMMQAQAKPIMEKVSKNDRYLQHNPDGSVKVLLDAEKEDKVLGKDQILARPREPGAPGAALGGQGGIPAYAGGLPPDVEAKIRAKAQQYGVPEDLALRAARRESRGQQGAVSPKGASGIMQLMPGTAADLGVDPNDPDQNIDGGVRYLAQQLKDFKDPALALAAYNAGPQRVRDAGNKVPNIKETQDYVADILGGGGGGGGDGGAYDIVARGPQSNTKEHPESTNQVMAEIYRKIASNQGLTDGEIQVLRVNQMQRTDPLLSGEGGIDPYASIPRAAAAGGAPAPAPAGRGPGGPPPGYSDPSGGVGDPQVGAQPVGKAVAAAPQPAGPPRAGGPNIPAPQAGPAPQQARAPAPAAAPVQGNALRAYSPEMEMAQEQPRLPARTAPAARQPARQAAQAAARPAGSAGSSKANPATPQSREEAARLPPGTWIRDPSGNVFPKA